MSGANGEVHGLAIGRKANRTFVICRIHGGNGFRAFPISFFVDVGHIDISIFQPRYARKLIALRGGSGSRKVELTVFSLIEEHRCVVGAIVVEECGRFDGIKRTFGAECRCVLSAF